MVKTEPSADEVRAILQRIIDDPSLKDDPKRARAIPNIIVQKQTYNRAKSAFAKFMAGTLTLTPDELERIYANAAARINGERSMEKFHEERAAAVAAVDVVGKQITEIAEKIKRATKDEEAAKIKGDSFFTTLTERLKEVEPLAKKARMSMKDLKLRYVGDRLGDTRFKLALRIARGRITHQQVNKDEAQKKAAQRAAENGRDNANVPTTQKNADETAERRASERAQAKAEVDRMFADLPDGTVAKIVERANNAAQDNTQQGTTSPAAKKPMDASTADMVAKHSQASKENLEKFAAALDLLNRMTTTDRQAARDRTEERWVELGIKKRGQAA